MNNAEYSKIQRILAIYDRFRFDIEQLKREHFELVAKEAKAADEEKLEDLRRFIDQKF